VLHAFRGESDQITEQQTEVRQVGWEVQLSESQMFRPDWEVEDVQRTDRSEMDILGDKAALGTKLF
jgi:hypothetical protein